MENQEALSAEQTLAPATASSAHGVKNTDRELWRAPNDDRLFLTEGGGVGMDVGGWCVVKPIRAWMGAEPKPDWPPSQPGPLEPPKDYALQNAAPALLEALKGMLRVCPSERNGMKLAEYTAARAAITKATGAA